MKKIKSKNVQNYVMNDMVWKVDMPRLLKEIAECSKSTPYPVTFTILTRVLGILTERAIEINDPALNIIMMNLGLYEGVHDKTGLKDCEGNELYEHDVIKNYPFIPSEIVWSEELSGYYLTHANGKIYEKPLGYYLSLGKFIVIGNKFDKEK